MDFAPVADVLTKVEQYGDRKPCLFIGCKCSGTDGFQRGDRAAGDRRERLPEAFSGTWGHSRRFSYRRGADGSDERGDGSRGILPFQSGIEAGADMIMVRGHITAPNLTDGDSLPASISEKIIAGMLRNELGYQGIIITDAMNMGSDYRIL